MRIAAERASERARLFHCCWWVCYENYLTDSIITHNSIGRSVGECRQAGSHTGRNSQNASGPLSLCISCVNRELNTNQNRLFKSFEKCVFVFVCANAYFLMLVSMHRTLISVSLSQCVCFKILISWLLLIDFKSSSSSNNQNMLSETNKISTNFGYDFKWSSISKSELHRFCWIFCS